VQLLKQTMPTLPILPVDLFSRGTNMRWDLFKHTQADYYIDNYPEILDLKVNGVTGTYDVVGLTNWQSAPHTKTLKFGDKLGLEPGRKYIAFDFWNQNLLGTFKDSLQLEVASHDTRVLLIRPLLDHPQLIGNSRHISGAYSISGLSWDPAAKQLRGTSETMAGEPYTLFVHVPEGYKQRGVRASAGAATVKDSPAQGTLTVNLQGQNEPVKWQIDFAN
jgi:hypothetical protein